MRFRIGRILGWIARYQCVFMVLSLLLTPAADEISIQKKRAVPDALIAKNGIITAVARGFMRWLMKPKIRLLEHLGLGLWKCVIFRQLVCLLLFIC